jgi:hypothetical protein
MPLGNDLTICQRLGANGEKEAIRFIQVADGKNYIQTVKKLISILAPIPTIEKEVADYEVTSIPLPDLELGTSDFKTNYCHLAFKSGVLLSALNICVEDFNTPKIGKIISLSAIWNSPHIDWVSLRFFDISGSKSLPQYIKSLKFFGAGQTKTFLVPVLTFLRRIIGYFGFLKKRVPSS